MSDNQRLDSLLTFLLLLFLYILQNKNHWIFQHLHEQTRALKIPPNQMLLPAARPPLLSASSL